ncbi:MAG TPA: ABC transporter permease [Pyrinomonadaceae bacterium]|nr:ABC transporter permease [Pyrinomonadaceae bacterium]
MTTTNSAGALEPAGSTAASVNQVGPHFLSPHPLPDEPLVTVQPSKSWAALDLRGLWAYRELLYFLVWRDIKVRYKQTLLGVSWVVLQPLLTTLVFTIFLGMLLHVPTDGVPYALFVYVGMMPWTFFTGAVNTTSNSLVGNSNLITKVYFPRALIPVSAIAARLLDFAISFGVLVALMAYLRYGLTWRILMLPVLVALVTLLALGLGMAASALNVKHRDVGVLVPLMLQLWMYASPVVYPVSIIPEGWRGLYRLNPLVGVIEGFRSSILGRGFDWPALGVSAAFTLALLVAAAFSFRRMETQFADIV